MRKISLICTYGNNAIYSLSGTTSKGVLINFSLTNDKNDLPLSFYSFNQLYKYILRYIKANDFYCKELYRIAGGIIYDIIFIDINNPAHHERIYCY